MAYLYLVTEDDHDDLFFQACIERLSGKAMQILSRRLRKGGGIGAARKAIHLVASEIRHMGAVEDVYLVVALDNDRSQIHPHHTSRLDPGKLALLRKRERNKPCRFCEIERALVEELGARSTWPVKAAIAVPVEMLESWLLLISNPTVYTDEKALPLFSEKVGALAQCYFAPHAPPDQLKDLCASERKRVGRMAMEDFCWECATEWLDPDALAAASQSFSMFRQQVEAWG